MKRIYLEFSYIFPFIISCLGPTWSFWCFRDATFNGTFGANRPCVPFFIQLLCPFLIKKDSENLWRSVSCWYPHLSLSLQPLPLAHCCGRWCGPYGCNIKFFLERINQFRVYSMRDINFSWTNLFHCDLLSWLLVKCFVVIKSSSFLCCAGVWLF